MTRKRRKYTSDQKVQISTKHLVDQIPFDPLSSSKRSVFAVTLLRRLLGLLGEVFRRRVSYVLDKALWHDPRVLGSQLGSYLSLDMRCPDGPTIFVVSDPLFLKDITEIDRLGRMNWIKCPRSALGSAQREFVRDIHGGQRFYFKSLAEPNAQPYWRMAEEFGIVLLAHADRLCHVDAVITSHVDYWQDEGLRRACGRLGRAFLVLCKENHYIPHIIRTVKNQFAELGFRFEGTAIATFSDRMRDLFVEAGVCTPDRVVVTGAPRMDGWRSQAMIPSRRVVMLSFLYPKSLFEDVDGTRRRRWSIINYDKACYEVLDALCARWAERGDFELIIKCKGTEDEQMIRQRIGEMHGLRICRDEPLHELIATASAVVGFNSMTMVESLLSNACLIIPRWGQTDRPTEELQFDPKDPLTRQVIRFAGSAEDLVTEVEAALAAPGRRNDRADRRALMRRFIHFSEDIPSAVKVADFVERFARHTPSTRNTSACLAK